MSQETPQVIQGGLVTLSRQLENILNQTRLYADIGCNCQPTSGLLQIPAESFGGTMKHLADQLEEACDTVQDILDFIQQK